MRLRTRIALLTTLVTVVLVVVAGVLVLRSFEAGERRRIDEQLSDQWRDLAQASVAVVRNNRPAVEQLLDLGVQAPLSVRVLDRGEVALSLGAGPVGGFAGAAPVGPSTVEVGGERWRVLAGSVTRATRPAQSFEVQFASPLGPLESAVSDLTRRVWFVAVVMAGLAAGLGWVVGGVALRPIARLRRRAADVATTADLALRVDADQGAAEVDALAAELNAMLQRLEEADAGRQEAFDAARSFAAAAAHELRTPLTSMQTNLEILSGHDELDHADRRDTIADLVAQQQRLLELLEALRMLARGDVVDRAVFEEVDLADLVAVSVREAQRRHPDVEFSVEVAEPAATVGGWPEGLRVMVDNLLANAAYHGRPAAGRAMVQVRLEARDGAVVLAVSDNGPGIPRDERAAVLERFRRGRAATGTGSGLGLALAAQQAALHGGGIAVGESELGGAELAVAMSPGVKLPQNPHSRHRESTRRISMLGGDGRSRR